MSIFVTLGRRPKKQLLVMKTNAHQSLLRPMDLLSRSQVQVKDWSEMAEDKRTFRPERFISQGDAEFNSDWEILESIDDTEEGRDKAVDEDDTPQVHPEKKPNPRPKTT